MSTRDKFRKLRSGVKSWISQGREAPSSSPGQTLNRARVSSTTPSYNLSLPWTQSSDLENVLVGTLHPASSMGQEKSPEPTPAIVPDTAVDGDSNGWPYLRLLGRTLQQSAASFGPLQAAIRGLVECTNIFESRFIERQEYEALRGDLEALCKVLQEGCMQPLAPNFTPMIDGLCRSMQAELSYIREKQGRSKLREYVEAENNRDEVLACYRRIQNQLQRVALNIDTSIWRIVDEIAADNRLKHMSPSLSACYNSSKATELKRGPCTQGTRVELLGQVISWLNSSTSGSVYWMSGMAGTGKTTIAYSLCLELDSARRLAASFFCSRLLPECRDVSLIIPSIAYQLSRSSHPFRAVLSSALEKDPDVYTRLPHLQFDTLIAQPLLEVKGTLAENLVVVIDALDECENKDSTSQMLDILLTRSLDLPVKFVVSSRPEPEIREEMTKQLNPTSSRVVLHEIDGDIVQGDIERYLRAALVRIEPSDEEIAILVQRAGILFIYAATVVRYIGYNNFRGNYHNRLTNVLSASSTGEKKYREIDELYATILQAAMDNPELEKADMDDIRQVLHIAICVQEPLAIETISRLLKLNDSNRVRVALQPLWSVLHVSDSSEMVTTLHASFPEYMLDPSRSGQYHCNKQIHNQALTLRCFDYFRGMRPQFNICNLESSFVPDNKVATLGERVNSVISVDLYYGARYWASHLCSTHGSPDLLQQLEEFLSVRLLLWMEVMNLKGRKGKMPGMIRMVEIWSVNHRIDLRELIHDAWRFTTAFASGAVSESTPHLYTSMLPSWPEASPIAKLYTRHTQGMINLKGTAIERQQRALLATWHFDHITRSPTFSPDGTQIVVGIEKDILLLNASTGRVMLPPFQGHESMVELVRFSPDGTRIVSSNDSDANNIRIWNVKNGETISKETAKRVVTAAFSSDGLCIALGQSDGSVDVRDSYTGSRLSRPFTWVNQPIETLKYSPDGRVVVSCDTNGNIVTWDAEDGKVLKALVLGQNEIDDDFTSVDISPDCTHVALGAGFKNKIYIRDINTGKIVLSCTYPAAAGGTFVTTISYSFDGLYIASGSSDGSICIWDTQNGDPLLCIPEGHTDLVTSVGFSPDGAYVVSGSYDKAIRLWDTHSTRVAFTGSLLNGHSKFVTSADFSPDSTRIVSAGGDRTVRVWDAESGDQVFGSLPLEPNPFRSNKIVATYSLDGASIICATDNGFALFDAQTGGITLRLHPKHLLKERSSMLSSDCTRIISFTRGSTSRHKHKALLRISAADTGQSLMVIHPQTIVPDANFVAFAVLSPDNSQIAVGLDGHNLCIMDSSSGRLLYGPYNDYPLHSTVWFSHDGTRIAQGFSSIMVREVRTGKILLGPLEGSASGVNSLQFSSDGSWIVFGSQDNTICVWDARSGERVLGPIKWHTAPIRSVRFSPDGTRIVSGSQDKTIRVTDVRANLEELSASTSPTGRDWNLNTDGWVIDDQERLLAWVPPELHAALMWPRTKLLISSGGWLRLDFSGAYLGESWAECYRPS